MRYLFLLALLTGCGRPVYKHIDCAASVDRLGQYKANLTHHVTVYEDFSAYVTCSVAIIDGLHRAAEWGPYDYLSLPANQMVCDVPLDLDQAVNHEPSTGGFWEFRMPLSRGVSIATYMDPGSRWDGIWSGITCEHTLVEEFPSGP